VTAGNIRLKARSRGQKRHCMGLDSPVTMQYAYTVERHFYVISRISSTFV